MKSNLSLDCSQLNSKSWITSTQSIILTGQSGPVLIIPLWGNLVVLDDSTERLKSWINQCSILIWYHQMKMDYWEWSGRPNQEGLRSKGSRVITTVPFHGVLQEKLTVFANIIKKITNNRTKYYDDILFSDIKHTKNITRSKNVKCFISAHSSSVSSLQFPVPSQHRLSQSHSSYSPTRPNCRTSKKILENEHAIWDIFQNQWINSHVPLFQLFQLSPSLCLFIFPLPVDILNLLPMNKL